MGYENAPQTKMLATHCIICSKPLCDAVSVEIGLGPVCRKRAGYADCNAENREAANVLIHKIALGKDIDARLEALRELHALGFDGVAAAIGNALASVTIKLDADGRYEVHTPYNPAVVDAMRKVHGRKWNKERKVNTFPTASRKVLWHLLQHHYAGRIAVGPKGAFKL